MSALCNGKVQRDGHLWSCLDCGCIGTAWSTAHQQMQTRVEHFQTSLVDLAKEADKLDVVVAVQPAT